ncbi:MAG: response regulator [Zetaproteobacteria bacterium]|nr:response regulator [Zetaproteobacteria bacterium]
MQQLIRDLNILVVDDEPDLVEAVSFEFELLGAQVRCAHNGDHAWEVIREGGVDVVISDIRMAGSDGVELLRKTMRAESEDAPPVIFMSGYADITLEEAYDEGAIAVFGKPYKRNELLDVVAGVAESSVKRWSTIGRAESSEIRALKEDRTAGVQARVQVGRGGVFMPLSEGFPHISDLVSFEFEIEDGHTVMGNGWVRWVRRSPRKGLLSGVGIEVRGIFGNSRLASVEKFCQHSCSVAFIPIGKST